MAGNFQVGMTLTAKDEASRVLAKGAKEAARAATDAEKAAARVGAEQRRTNEQSQRSARTTEAEYRRAAQARENLGVRSEQSIRREIAQTIASYNRLTRSGVMSSREQERAFRAMKEQVRGLRHEMGGVSRSAAMLQNGRSLLAVGGGLAAGAMVAARPVQRQMAYQRQLSMMANTAFSDEGQAGRLAGRDKMDRSIRYAVGYGGGTKEDAAEAMNTMLASGVVSYDTANKWLPDLMKFATASGASALDLSTLAIKGKQSFGLRDEDVPVAINMAIAAGKAGGFELSDMARWLAPQMAAAGNAGMKGIDDFSKLLTLNEAANITAGSADEAGNNVVNLLAKLTSADAANSAKKIKINGHGIDLPGTLAAAREKGIDPIEAFSRVVDKVVSSDAGYQQLQKRLAATKDTGDRRAVMESMATILEGSGVGKILADRQALMALLAYRNNPEYRQQVATEVNRQRTLPEGKRVGDEDFQFIAGTNDFKVERARNVADFAQLDSVKRLADVSGSAADKLADLGNEFPGLTSAVMGATTAIQSMTAAAVAFAGLKFITGGAAGMTGGAAATTAATAAATRGGGLLSGMGRLAGAGGIATAFATMTTAEEDAAVNGSQERWAAIRAKYPQSVIDAARKKYQPWYQFGEGYSTENEQWIQRYLADENSAANADVPVTQVTTPGAAASAAGTGAAAPAVALNGPTQPVELPPVNLTAQLMLDGQMLAEVVNQYNIQDGNRGTGGTPQ